MRATRAAGGLMESLITSTRTSRGRPIALCLRGARRSTRGPSSGRHPWPSPAPRAGVLASASPMRTGSMVQRRRALLQEIASGAANATAKAPAAGLGSTADKSSDRDLVGKLVLTITLQADFAPLQDSNAYQTFRAELQQNLAKAASVPATDIEVVSITPGSIVCLTIINYYSVTAEEQSRMLINAFTKEPASSLPADFQASYGKVSAASGRWIKAKVAGERPARLGPRLAGAGTAVAACGGPALRGGRPAGGAAAPARQQRRCAGLLRPSPPRLPEPTRPPARPPTHPNAGASPGLTDSQMMGIWIAVAIAIIMAVLAVFLTLRIRFGWCAGEELDNAKFDPRDLPVPLSISSRRITSQDAEAAKVRAAAAAGRPAGRLRRKAAGRVLLRPHLRTPGLALAAAPCPTARQPTPPRARHTRPAGRPAAAGAPAAQDQRRRRQRARQAAAAHPRPQRQLQQAQHHQVQRRRRGRRGGRGRRQAQVLQRRRPRRGRRGGEGLQAQERPVAAGAVSGRAAGGAAGAARRRPGAAVDVPGLARAPRPAVPGSGLN
jgi:hypothetical protein